MSLAERLGRKWMEEPPRFPVRYDEAARWWINAIADELDGRDLEPEASYPETGSASARWLREQAGENP